jgi:hypothetical protein
VRGLVTFFVDMLPLESWARRAVDETLADWSHEESECDSVAQRVIIVARGTWSLVDVLLRSIGTGLFSAATMRTCLTCLGLALAFGALLPFFWIFRGPWLPLPLNTRLEMLVLLAPWAMAMALPLAVLTLASRAKAASWLTVCVWLCTLSFVAMGWIMPETNQAFRERAALHNNPQPLGLPTPELPRGNAELSLPTLLTLSAEDSWRGERAWKHLQGRWALTALVPACLLAGTQAARLTRARRWRAGGLLLSGSILLFTLGLFVWAERWSSVLVRLGKPSMPAELLWTYNYWLLPFTLILLSTVLATFAHRAERRTTLNAA